MKDSRHGAHTGFELHLPVVWVTQYRRPALTGAVALRVRDMSREICGQHDVTMRKGQGSKEHVPLVVSSPPQVTSSRLRQGLKGKTADKLVGEVPPLRKTFWGRHRWARGSFWCSAGNVTDEVSAASMTPQSQDQDEDCKVDG
jgi:putative transposase